MNTEVGLGLGKEGVGECSVWDIRNFRAYVHLADIDTLPGTG